MTQNYFLKWILTCLLILMSMTLAHAGSPVWTVTPLTATTLTVFPNDTTTVRYQITNQSRKSHTLEVKPITGITQVTTAGNCPATMVLGDHQSCILNLTISGSSLRQNIVGGPVICEQGNSNQCYQPASTGILNITKGSAPTSYTVGGSVSGLSGSLVLKNNGGNNLTVNANGTFTFSEPVSSGSQYSVTIQTQPATQTCTISNGSGIVTNSNVTNVGINCTTNTATVGGAVFGLTGTLVLQNNGTDNLTINADGSFTFPTPLPVGSTYSVTVQNQPATQTCTVSNGSGTINSNVTNVTVNCSVNTRTIGGTTSGLAGAQSVVLQNNGSDNLTVTSNGSFTFATPVAQGSTYSVTVLTQPATQTCSVINGSGTATTSNITNVQVTCATNAYTLGGTISGLLGTVVLQNSGADNLSVSSNGSFTFATPVAQGSNYNVTVLTQPPGQTCTVTNGSGTMGGSNVTNVGVSCVTNSTSLSTSISDLVLSVTGFTEYGIAGTPASGVPRIITITNTGSFDAVNLVVTPPTWPTNTTSSTTCNSTLTAGSSCTITITPGNTPTSNGTNPCSTSGAGTAPIPQTVQVTALNASTVSTNVVILSYGCIYQGGYVFSFDDSLVNTASVGGKIMTTTNQSAGVIWSSNGASGGTSDVVYDSIYGIAENSTTSSPSPSTGQVSGQTACNGALDGLCDTQNIYTYYQNNASGAPINLSYYASGVCKQTIGGYSNWYLPSMCEMSYKQTGICFISAHIVEQNIQTGLMDFNSLNLLSGNYWSSTASSSGNTSAWSINYASGGNTTQLFQNKIAPFAVRCVRSFTTQSIGGTITGLDPSTTVVLQNNGGDNITLGPGIPFAFTFPTRVNQGSPYNVTILTQPSRRTCMVTNGSGIVGTSDITDVQVTCA